MKLNAIVCGIAASLAVTVFQVSHAGNYGHHGYHSKKTIIVTSADDTGAGTLRDAIEQANAYTAIKKIAIKRGLAITLDSPVEYTGTQNLSVHGRNATINGNGSVDSTWDSGLLVSRSAADLSIKNIAFVNSPNNGVGVFIPADARGVTQIKFNRVAVTGSQFHGIFIDGQSSSGYNTDGMDHPACVDPHPVESAGSISVVLVNSQVIGNGVLADTYDDSYATGCPRDFDGLRVNEGADGHLFANIVRSSFDLNLADGVELDETGDGDVRAWVKGSSFDANGDSGVNAAGDADLDDGFDIDEVGAGGISAFIRGSTFNGNFDEGIKADEEEAGSLSFRMIRSTANNSLSQDGVQLTETGNGNFVGTVKRSEIKANDNDGFKADQEDDGSGRLLISNSDLSGNNDDALDIGGFDSVIENNVIK